MFLLCAKSGVWRLIPKAPPLKNPLETPPCPKEKMCPKPGGNSKKKFFGTPSWERNPKGELQKAKKKSGNVAKK